MKLSKTVLQRIAGSVKTREAKAVRTTLALALNFTERWVLKCLQENKDNGPLTLTKSVQILEKCTGLSSDEILTQDADPLASVQMKKRAISKRTTAANPLQA
jgi:hypothetical protein